MSPLFLQTLTTVPDSSAVQLPQQTAPATLSLLDLAMRGGPIMIPLFILFSIALYLFIERLLYVRQASQVDTSFLRSVRELLIQGNIRGAENLCEGARFPVAHLLRKGISRLGSPIRDIENAIENAASVEIFRMEKNLGFLTAIAAIAPMLGFLGTVTGMIRAFHNMSVSDNISIGIIAGGIYEKMITSATGLIIGILAHAFHTILSNRIDRNVHQLEVTAIDFMDLLHKPIKA